MIDKVLDGSAKQVDINREIALIEQKIQDRGMQSVLDEYGIDIDVAQLQADYKELVSDGGNVYTENQTDGIKSRFLSGYERRGPFEHNDKGGIEYLNLEMAFWSAILGSAAGIALTITIIGWLAAVPTGGLSVAIANTIVAACIAIIPFCWGMAGAINNCIQQAASMCERGLSYTVERYWFLGITTGYSVY